MTDLVYDHKYFVDLRPRIFDVQIFNDDADHPNGWGTILVGGMRFGGSKVQPGGYDEDGDPRFDFNGDNLPDYSEDFNNNGSLDVGDGEDLNVNGTLEHDNREFTSAYFILDITNPEKPPKLLAEFTRTLDDPDGAPLTSPEVELGYSTNISTMVPMRINEDFNDDGAFDNDGTPGNGEDQNCNGVFDVHSKWYLIIGSGPTDLDGTSTQQGNVSVIPLDRFVDTSGAGTDPVLDMRIPADVPFSATAVPMGKVAANAEFGSFDLPDAMSFTADLITVDMETNQDYMADVVYFGSNYPD
jgi:type IV pilus assembly protein PilY1